MCKTGNSCYIDTHAHLWSEEYLNRLEELGSPDTAVARNIGAGTSENELEQRIQMMDKAGVKYQILSATPQPPQWGLPTDAYSLSQKINNLYADIQVKYPNRFVSYGAVPLPFVDQAIKEGTRAIKELGFVGVAVNTIIQNEISIADDRFLPFFEAMNELHAIIYIHPTGCGAKSDLVNDYGLEWVVGAPIEDIIAPLQLLKKDFPRRFPNLKFHIAHLGGGLPFLLQRIEDNYEDWNAFTQSPTKSLKEHFWFDTANFHEPALICSQASFGNSQLLLGSDFPYFQNEKYTRAVQYIKEADLSKEEIDNILYYNAHRLFGEQHFRYGDY